MGRTNSMWRIDIFYNTEKSDFIKTLNANTLREIAYLFDMEVYDISNFYHKITKPKGVLRYITLSKN